MAFKHQFLHLMILGQPDLELEGDADNTDGFDLNHLKKRAKYIHFSKNYVWSYWKKEYLRGLTEQHNLAHNSNELKLKEEDVVIIRGNEKNRAHCSAFT